MITSPSTKKQHVTNLIIFDLDHTLINGDSAVLWNEFVYQQGLSDDPKHWHKLHAFDRAYHAGTLDAQAYQRFTMTISPDYTLTELTALRDKYFSQKIAPLMHLPAQQLIEQHQQRGELTILISATNSFLTDPVCQHWAIDINLSTQPEVIKGRFTGRVCGEPSLKAGKIRNLEQWFCKQGFGQRPNKKGFSKQDLGNANITFYSDSHNDLPLLEQANHPIAVDPDPTLRHQAQLQQWPIISLRPG